MNIDGRWKQRVEHQVEDAEFEQWLLAALSPPCAAFVSSPVEREADEGTADWLARSISLFDGACDFRDSLEAGATIVWVLPLLESQSLSTDSPSLSAVVGDVEGVLGVPTIYVLSGVDVLSFDAAEDYRETGDWFPSRRAEVRYYRCWRREDERKKGWEFARALYYVSSARR